jgi:hypothetical protein
MIREPPCNLRLRMLFAINRSDKRGLGGYSNLFRFDFNYVGVANTTNVIPPNINPKLPSQT